jgi:hypothetical protein
MQNSANTDNQTQAQDLLMDREDWQLGFEAYEGHPSAALRLGFNVAILRTYLDSQRSRANKLSRHEIGSRHYQAVPVES